MFGSLKKFMLTLLLLTLALMVLGYGLFLYVVPQHYFSYFPVIPAFILVVTLLVHAFLIKDSGNNPRKFTAKYLGAMGLKMFIYLLFLMVILFLDTAHAVPFLICFLVSYASFTTYEVMAILKFLKKDR